MNQDPVVDDDVRAVVSQLCEAYPRFPRPTIERLVERSRRGLHGLPAARLPELVRRTATEQLEYLDGGL